MKTNQKQMRYAWRHPVTTTCNYQLVGIGVHQDFWRLSGEIKWRGNFQRILWISLGLQRCQMDILTRLITLWNVTTGKWKEKKILLEITAAINEHSLPLCCISDKLWSEKHVATSWQFYKWSNFPLHLKILIFCYLPSITCRRLNDALPTEILTLT